MAKLRHSNESTASVIQCTDQFSPLWFTAEQCRLAERGSAWQNRGWISALSQVDTLRVVPWSSESPSGWSHHFPSQAFESLFQPGSWITVTHSCSSSPMMGSDHEGNIFKKTVSHTHLPKRPSHAVLSRSPLLSQFFRLCVCSLCLWHSPVFEKPPSRRTLPSLCALCVFMQACTLVSPCAVRLSSSFDKLTCKGGLFTGLRVGHVWPPGMQALASLRVCKIILILRAWSFAMCWGFLLAFTRTHLREFEPVGLWFWHIWE